MNNQLLLLLLFVLLSLELLCLSKQKWLQRLLTGKPRVHKPKSEKDCPCCEAAHVQGTPVSTECSHAAPISWSQRKGKGGRKKTISTQGYFCSNPDCGYLGVVDESLHALVGYGRHGRHEDIQDLRCQACDQKFTVRRHTPLYRLKTHSPIVSLSLQLLALGVDASALQETLNISEATLRTWLVRSGVHGRKLHEHFFTALELVHLQLDELWANVRQSQQAVWLWTVCEAKSKLIPVIQLGPRTQVMAYSVVHELKDRLKPGCVPVFSSDGLKHYFYALTAHFGEWLRRMERRSRSG